MLVFVDESGDPGLKPEQGSSTHFVVALVIFEDHDEPGQRYIKSLKVQNSAKNNLVQLADMVAGAIYRSMGAKPDAREYRRLLGHREISVQVWPK